MALSEEQHERLSLMLQELEPELKRVYPSGRKFVEDQVKRLDEYGVRMSLSPKQWKWLQDIHQEFVGGTPQTTGDDFPDEGDGPGDDIDDSIPF